MFGIIGDKTKALVLNILLDRNSQSHELVTQVM